MKKVVSLLLAAVILVTLAAGCGSAKVEDTKASQTTMDNKTGLETEDNSWLGLQKKKWHIGDNLSVNWYLNYSWVNMKEWQEYPLLKEVSEITGVTPKVLIPAGDGTEKLNLMISTNDLPDVITMDQNDANVTKLIKQGLLYSYDELMDKYVPEFRNEIPDEVYRYIKSDVDGKLYGLPSWFVPKDMANNQYSYNARKDIYEELGSPDITTPEGLRNALLLFKEKYPEIEGKKSIALSLGASYNNKVVLEHSFGIREFYEDNNTLLHKYRDPRYENFVKYINGLYRDGLLDQEGYVKKDDQIKEDLATRTFMAGGGCWDLWTTGDALDAKKPDSHFVVIDPPMKALGEDFAWGQYKTGWTISLVTKAAKNPDVAIKFIRYLWSPDGNLLTQYGHEGEDYKIEGNKIIRSDRVNEGLAKDWGGYTAERGLWQWNWLQYSYWDGSLRGAFTEAEDRARDRALANSYVKYDSTPYQYRMNPDPTSSEGIIATQVSEVEKKEYPKIIMAKSEDEAVKAYLDMVAKMDKVGLPKLEQWWNEQYKRNIEKFQAK